MRIEGALSAGARSAPALLASDAPWTLPNCPKSPRGSCSSLPERSAPSQLAPGSCTPHSRRLGKTSPARAPPARQPKPPKPGLPPPSTGCPTLTAPHSLPNVCFLPIYTAPLQIMSPTTAQSRLSAVASHLNGSGLLKDEVAIVTGVSVA